ncbi:WPP domain-interacting protein 2-like isoform X2 [Tripterygium wilfordii]|uniref:WPP domain-interacting protein 2-like isoform X2 n=1 Tax=Tripterygium wilfordii TaxID=458696 RepID=A0A7J7CM89_TRIWF|nr:WPP domain-interacting protein 2-like isoform X2 [Tripterygium wilfordii]
MKARIERLKKETKEIRKEQKDIAEGHREIAKKLHLIKTSHAQMKKDIQEVINTAYDMDVARQTLHHDNVVLEDNRTVQSYDFKESYVYLRIEIELFPENSPIIYLVSEGENSDEASEPLSREEVHTGYNKKNVGYVDLLPDDVAADSSWADKGEDGENHRPGTNQDPLVESIHHWSAVRARSP